MKSTWKWAYALSAVIILAVTGRPQSNETRGPTFTKAGELIGSGCLSERRLRPTV
jgi:hypothetical protein